MIGTQQKRNNYVFGLQKGVVESGATRGMEQVFWLEGKIT